MNWKLTSPSESVVVDVRIGPVGNERIGLFDVGPERDALTYEVRQGDRIVAKPSRLGLWFGGAPPLINNFTCLNIVEGESDESWEPVCGERSEVRNHYCFLDIAIQESIKPYRLLTVEFRAYDHGIAFRYAIPEQQAFEEFTVVHEVSQFNFPEGCVGWATYTAQGTYERKAIRDIGTGCERPLTVVNPNGFYCAVGEAGNADSPRMKIRNSLNRVWAEGVISVPAGEDILESDLSGPVRARTPWFSPWRYIIIGDRPGDLIERNDLLMNLSTPNAIGDTSWIKPGKVIREVTLSVEGGRACVDFAAEHGISYVHLDTGWYGNEIDDHGDATEMQVEDLRRSGHPGLTDVNIPDLVQYGKKKGIGVICYLNRRVIERQADEVFDLLAEWGVAGMKFGFVEVGDQAWTIWLHKMVEKAAKRRLIVDIHDEYRGTGIFRTYPNLMTVEGIHGNECFPDADHNTTLPFTRFVCGPGDYTICIYSGNLKNRRTHQLALSVVYFSPLQYVYWYDQPKQYDGSPALKFLDDVPTVWDDTKVLEGLIGEYVVTARRKGQDWYIGTITNNNPRALVIDLGFLDEEVNYTVEIYRDPVMDAGLTAVEMEKRTVRSIDTIEIAMLPRGGAALRFSLKS